MHVIVTIYATEGNMHVACDTFWVK